MFDSFSVSKHYNIKAYYVWNLLISQQLKKIILKVQCYLNMAMSRLTNTMLVNSR